MYRKKPYSTAFSCFSKRSLKQQTLTFNSYHFNSKFRNFIINSIETHSVFTRIFIRYNYWLFNKQHFNIFFLKSSFCRILTDISSSKKVSMYKAWFIYKNVFLKKLLMYLHHYTNYGILSSHYVHFMVKKNLTYQIRSKYRTRIFNLVNNQVYIYLYSILLQSYSSVIYKTLHQFNLSFNLQSNSVTEDFTKITPIYYSNTLKYSNTIKRTFSNFNNIKNINTDYKYDNIIITVGDWVFIYKHIDLIFDYLSCKDSLKTEALHQKIIHTLPSHLHTYIHKFTLLYLYFEYPRICGVQTFYIPYLMVFYNI